MTFTDTVSRTHTRVAFIYGLEPRLPNTVYSDKNIGDAYEYGRFADHITSGQDLFPRVIFTEQLIGGEIGDKRITDSLGLPEMQSLRIILTSSPRRDVTLVIDGVVKDDINVDSISNLLATTCFDRLQMRIDNSPIADWLRQRVTSTGVQLPVLTFGNDVHQCVFAGHSQLIDLDNPVKANQAATTILYRATVPVGTGDSVGIHMPAGLNNPGNTFVAHGRGVSAFAGWSVPMENAFVLIAISVVSALGVLRRVRHQSFHAMALNQDATLTSPHAARALVTQLSEQLNDMQLDLSFGVEAHIDSILIPEMVPDAFQTSLNDAVQMRQSLDNTSRMLERVSAVIDARRSQLEVAKNEHVERRNRIVAIIVGTGSLLALPPALLLTYFGIASKQEIFGFNSYWPAYLVAWFPFVLLVTVGGFFYFRSRLQITELDGKGEDIGWLG